MKNCSRGYDLAEMLRQKALIEYEMGDYEVALKTAEESLSEYVYGNGWINNSTASLFITRCLRRWLCTDIPSETTTSSTSACGTHHPFIVVTEDDV